MATNILNNGGSFGAVLAAVAASLCCILPVIAIAFGFGAFGIASASAPLRPYFLVVAAGALVYGFYRTYFRKEHCAEGEACAAKPVGRLNKTVLWIATIAVIALAAFPYYTSFVIAAITTKTTVVESSAQPSAIQNLNATAAIEGESQNRKTIVIGVEGMTCEGCASQLNIALKRIDGVIDAQASYPNKNVTVVYNPEKVTIERIKQGIRDAGYDAT